MKYLLIRDRRYQTGKEVTEFATAEELSTELLLNGSAGAIIAQRIDVKLSVCEYIAPIAAPAEIELVEAA